MVTESQFVKHALKENDTLTSVANDFDVSIEYLILVHNLHVENYDKIKNRLNFPEHLKEIYIHLDTAASFAQKKNKERTKNNPNLIYKPILAEKKYQVLYSFLDGDEETNLSFQTSITALKKSSNQQGFIVEINRTEPTLINNALPDLVIDELAIETAKVIYPLQIVLNNKGAFVAIHNHDEIVKRWEAVKEKVNDNFESQWIDQYILWTETTILSQEKLLASLKKDWFINTYFLGIYTNYYTNYKINTTILFPVIPNLENFEYLAVQEINKYTDQEDQLIITQTGKIDTSKTNTIDYLQFLDEIDGNFEAKYTLDPIDNSIKNIALQCSLAFATPKKLTVEITLQ